MERKPIQDASAQELRAFATTVLALEVKPTSNRETLISQIRTVYAGDTIAIFPEAGAPGPKSHTSAVRRERPMEKYPNRREVAINVHRDPRPGAPDPIWVSVNGRGMWIPRGVVSWVPEEYVGVLEIAKEQVYDEYDPDVDKGIGGLREPREVLSYPFSYA